MKYEIQVKIGSEWSSYHIGGPNEFDSYEEAEAIVPELARIFEDDPSQYRIVIKEEK